MATTPRRRRTRRVESTEPTRSKPRGSAKHKQTTEMPLIEGSVKLSGTDLAVSAQLSELVPVAQFANITLGPVQLQWVLGDVNMSVLCDVDWSKIESDEDLEELLDDEQMETWTRARRGLRATMMLLQFSIAEDREAVHDSVAAMNRAEAEAEKKRK